MFSLSTASGFYQTSSAPQPYTSETSLRTQSTAHREQLVKQAEKIQDATAILTNMGFEKSTASVMSQVIHKIHAGELDAADISQTSELGRALQEFQYRETAFRTVSERGEMVSESILNDLAIPLNAGLRSKAEQQALAVMEGRSISQRQTKTSEAGILQSITHGINSLASRVVHAMEAFDKTLFSFPRASAQETDKTTDYYRQDCTALFQSDFSADQLQHLRQLVAESNKTIQEELEKIKDKKSILIQGRTGVGKGTFINYLFSNRCEFLDELTCDTPIVDTSAERDSHTRYIKAFAPKGELEKALDSDTVLVDSPGFYDTRRNHLNSLIYALYASKSAFEIKKRTHISVYLLEYKSYIVDRGIAIDEMREIIDSADNRNKAIVITKAYRKAEFEAQEYAEVHSSKEALKANLKKREYSDHSIEQTILYDVIDGDIASTCTKNRGRYECIGGGETPRKQIINKFQELFAHCNPSETHEHVVDLSMKDKVMSMRKALEGFLEKGALSLNFEQFAQAYQRFAILLEIDHPLLNEIQSHLQSMINGKIAIIDSEIDNLTTNILEDGNGSAFEAIFQKIESLKSFTQLPTRLLSIPIPDKILEIGKKIQQKCQNKIFSIFRQQTTWDDPGTQEKAKLAFRLIDRVDEKLSIRPLFYQNQTKPKLDEFFEAAEQDYYQQLWTCSFRLADDRKIKFEKLSTLLEEAHPQYSYNRELESYEELQETFIGLNDSENTKLIIKTAAVLLAGGATLYFGGPALLAAKALISTQSYAALTFAGKTASIVKVLSEFTLGVGTLAGGHHTKTNIQSTEILCALAWVQSNFSESAPFPPPFENPSP